MSSTSDGPRLRVSDLYSGAGLLSFAFQCERFEVSLAIDNDPRAVETYRQNLGDHVICGDVSQISPFGECDVLIGGPPCQGFSTLGKRVGYDPRNTLALQFVIWARRLLPKVVVIENVAPFLRSAEWRQLADGLDALGYTVQANVLDATDYGAAQRRLRSFTIGTRVGPIEFHALPQFQDSTVRDAWKGLASRPNGVNSHYAPAPSPIARRRMEAIPPGGGKSDLMRLAPELCPPSWWRSRTELTDVWGRLRWDGPSNTIRTCFNNASKGRYIHPDQDRVISLREAARLQSIPDDFRFVGYPIDIARQIGNCVPPALGRTIASGVRWALSR